MINALSQLMTAAVICAIAFAMYITVDGLYGKPLPADVAIVFGSKAGPSGLPSPRLKARLDTALELYNSGVVPAIIVTGAKGIEGFDEAVVMKSYLMINGVPGSNIFADNEGASTLRSCMDADQIMSANNWHKADVVSQFFHISRAKFTCQHEGIDVVGSQAPRYFEIRDIYSLFREVVAVPFYWMELSKPKGS